MYAGRVDGDRVVALLPGDGHAGRWAVIDLAMGESGALRGLEPMLLDDVRLLAPVPEPGAVRDFYAFEAHVSTAHAARGKTVDPVWYEQPVFYFTNPHSILGPDTEVVHPGCEALDYELEVAAIVGRDLFNATPDEALAAIAGYTIMNDWSARDLQRREMRAGLGPAKGKDFATSIGPWMVTAGELPNATSGRPEATMIARVNGVEYSRGQLQDIHWSFGDLLSHASRNARVRRGDIIGSGTVGTGCILELSAVHSSEKFPWLKSGDTVELEVENIGVLSNKISN